ncbi:hypothetical protein FOH10_29535 [Nocardia otitidiscaviarum]|uniref:DNA-binding protein n=1 Tax=Nocardia otitidiscaviarum TaxID=1823 RepID=A0A516NTN1_9NOCA|nr:hypothetical protein [Nocardia otitidiscaviarum]MCP9621596.1 hypothetical protein [Nocardia otitidiscaviarum]QDP82262.1 hypothetical protein FOH10_29535 [Nocardia otitidiscaviarum]
MTTATNSSGQAHTRRWASTKDAAAHIHRHPEVLRRWHRQRAEHPWLPLPRRVGKNLLWDLDELDAAIDAQVDRDEGQ